jgi:hypothetical protein
MASPTMAGMNQYASPALPRGKQIVQQGQDVQVINLIQLQARQPKMPMHLVCGSRPSGVTGTELSQTDPCHW